MRPMALAAWLSIIVINLSKSCWFLAFFLYRFRYVSYLALSAACCFLASLTMRRISALKSAAGRRRRCLQVSFRLSTAREKIGSAALLVEGVRDVGDGGVEGTGELDGVAVYGRIFGGGMG